MSHNNRTFMTTLLCAVAAGALFMAPAGLAQDRELGRSPSFSLGPTVGMQKAEDADDANYLVGAQARLRLSPFFGLDGTISYRQEDYADNSVTVRSWPVQVSGLLYPLPIVYGTIGAGWYNVTFDLNDEATGPLAINDSETTTEFGWHFGGGVEIPISQSVNLTGDLRYVFLDYEFEQAPTSDEISSDFYMISGGLLFQL